jgi:hypothetical protein
MQRLEVSGAVRPLYGPFGVKGLSKIFTIFVEIQIFNQPAVPSPTAQGTHRQWNTDIT